MEIEIIAIRDFSQALVAKKPFQLFGGRSLPLTIFPFLEEIVAMLFAEGSLRGGLEPGMLIARVIEREIEQNPDAPFMGFLKQTIQIRHRPVFRVDLNNNRSHRSRCRPSAI
jgi:hypothetical protein